MVRTKNPSYVSEEETNNEEEEVGSGSEEEVGSGSEEEEVGCESEQGSEKNGESASENDSEKTHTDSETEATPSEAMKPLKMFFKHDVYNKTWKMSSKCYVAKAVEAIDKLSRSEKKWFHEHPQFRHFFHMHNDSKHKWSGMLMLLVRTACLEKKNECWFIVNGIPVRYSLREMTLISGLYCHPYPKNFRHKYESTFVEKIFNKKTITHDDVKNKLESMKPCPNRLTVAVLYFLSSVIIGKKKIGKGAAPVENFFLRAVSDLDFCKTFPWGRLAFDQNMKDIAHMMNHMNGVLVQQWMFPSFVIPLELLAFEAIHVLKRNFRECENDSDPECPRMCKTRFKTGFCSSEVLEKLGTTKKIQSILEPSTHEEVLLSRVFVNEGGYNDENDAVADGWHKILVEEKGKIFFKDLYLQDVATRSEEAIAAPGNEAIAAPCNEAIAAPGNEDQERGLLGFENRLMSYFECGFNRIVEKISVLDEKIGALSPRLSDVEAYVKLAREERNDDRTRAAGEPSITVVQLTEEEEEQGKDKGTEVEGNDEEREEEEQGKDKGAEVEENDEEREEERAQEEEKGEEEEKAQEEEKGEEEEKAQEKDGGVIIPYVRQKTLKRKTDIIIARRSPYETRKKPKN